MVRKLILALIFSSIAMLTFCQNQPDLITIKFNNVSIPEAISELSTKTNYRFAYNSSELRQDSVSESFKKEKLSVILNQILPQNHSFNLKNRLVVIYKVDNNQPSSSGATAYNISIQGEVLDINTGEPLPYAYLYIPSNKANSESDGNGKFSVLNVPNDTSLIKVSYVGYDVKDFYLNPEMNKDNIQIVLSATNVIKTVNVSPEDVPISISRNSEVNQLNYLKNKQLSNVGESDALSMIKYVPGFNVAADGEETYSFLGLKSDENSYLLDGTNVIRPTHFFGQFSSINSLSIKNIRVLKGGYSAEFGGRTGALIDINSLDGNAKNPELKVRAGLLGISARVNSSLFKEKASFTLTTRRSYAPILKSGLFDPLLNSVINSNVFIAGDTEGLALDQQTVNADVKFSDTYGKFTLKPTKNLVVQLNGFYNDDLSNLSYLTELNNQEIGIAYNTELFWINYGGAASVNWNPTNALTISSKLSSTFLENTSNSIETISDFIVNENQVLQSEFFSNIQEINQKTKLEYTFSDSLKIRAGLDISSVETINQESTFGVELYNDIASQNTWSGFLESELSTGKFRSRVGWRFSRFATQNFHAPRVRISSELGKNLFLNLGYGKHFQFLRKVIPLNLFTGAIDQWRLAENNIQPSENEYFSISLQKRLKFFTLHAELTKNTQKNALEPISNLFQGAREISVNIEDLYSGIYKNLSFNSSVQFNKNGHSVAANYLGAQSIGQFTIDDEVLEFKNPRVSDHSFSLFWLWNNDRFKTSSSVIYSTGKPITPIVGSYVTEIPNGEYRPFFVFGNINSAQATSFFRIDLSFGYKFILSKSAILEIDLAVQNILNRQNLNFKTNTFLETENPSDFTILSREINFLGRTPSLFISFSF